MPLFTQLPRANILGNPYSFSEEGKSCTRADSLFSAVPLPFFLVAYSFFLCSLLRFFQFLLRFSFFLLRFSFFLFGFFCFFLCSFFYFDFSATRHHAEY
jgi:hypothetical protein